MLFKHYGRSEHMAWEERACDILSLFVNLDT